MKIADSLTHVTPDGRWFGTRHDASFDRLRRELDASGTERAVVVALAGAIENSFVSEVCARDSRLVAGCSFDPTAHDDPAAAFRAELHDSGFRVLKLHPRLNRYDPLEPRCMAVLDELAAWERPMVVWIDTLFDVSRMARGSVESAATLVARFPTLTFVLLHAAGPDALSLCEAVRPYGNANVDLSFTMHRWAGSSLDLDLAYLMRTFDRRLLFGSDFPEYGIAESIARLHDLGSDVANDKLTNILGGNLLRILNHG